MAQVWIQSSDKRTLVRADSLTGITTWTVGKNGHVGLVRDQAKDATPVASVPVDFGTQPFSDAFVLDEANSARRELVRLIHQWENNAQHWDVVIASDDHGKWILV